MRVLRLLVSRKWLAYHALAIVLIVAFIFLGRWQWHSAMAKDGTLQNLFYAFNWWLFAVLVVYGWVKTLRDDLGELGDTSADGEHAPIRERPTVALPALYAKARSPELDEPLDSDPELVAYNAYLAELNARASGRDSRENA